MKIEISHYRFWKSSNEIYAIIDVPYSYGELSILLKDSCLTMPSWVYVIPTPSW